VQVKLDPAGGAVQSYGEDCEVCCRSWQVNVRYGTDGQAQVSLTALEG
jgi:hypothetical protein